MEKELKVKSSSERPRRVTLGERNRISIAERDPNYQYRLVSSNLESDPDRVQRLMDIGYEIVPGKAAGKTGDSQVGNPSAIGSAGQVSVGKGDKAVWMRIPKDWFAEDQAEKQREVNLSEQRVKNKEGADYGSVEMTSSRG